MYREDLEHGNSPTLFRGHFVCRFSTHHFSLYTPALPPLILLEGRPMGWKGVIM